jgi:hypothetical protein
VTGPAGVRTCQTHRGPTLQVQIPSGSVHSAQNRIRAPQVGAQHSSRWRLGLDLVDPEAGL